MNISWTGANVVETGAVPDGKTISTRAIQQAIDRCAAAGGGTVYFPPGTYLSGTLFMKSHVTLYLESNAILLGSTDLKDYPVVIHNVESRTQEYNLRSLIYAEDLQAISFVGPGILDGNGKAFKDRSHDGTRPLLLRVVNCRDVLVERITMQNSAFWNQHYLACKRVRLQGIRVWNHATYNADGVDIDGCRDFIVAGCFFDSDDDALCLKSTSALLCENILISDCVISSHCNSIKMGTDSTGGFVNVTITNCAIVSPRESHCMCGVERGISGISLEIVDGGRMQRIVVSNITIDGVEVPIFIRLGNRGYGFLPSETPPGAPRHIGSVSDITLANITATRAGQTGCSITGLPGHVIEGVSLSNVAISSEGDGNRASASRPIPELPDRYPEATMFGKLPAFGLYCRHVRGLYLSGVRLQSSKPDSRHALVLEDVREATIDGLHGILTTRSTECVRLVEAVDILICRSRPVAPEGAFLLVEGKRSC